VFKSCVHEYSAFEHPFFLAARPSSHDPTSGCTLSLHSNTRATQGQRSGPSRDSLVVGEDADTECGNDGGAEAASSGAWSCGAVLTQSVEAYYIQRKSEHRWYCGDRIFDVQQNVASGAVGGFIGRQPVIYIISQRFLIDPIRVI
jgi:hypothetical protein